MQGIVRRKKLLHHLEPRRQCKYGRPSCTGRRDGSLAAAFREQRGKREASPEASGALVNTGPRGEVKQQQRRFFQESKTERWRERKNVSTKPPKLKNVTNMSTCPSGQP
jgi:hypothetical protein